MRALFVGNTGQPTQEGFAIIAEFKKLTIDFIQTLPDDVDQHHVELLLTQQVWEDFLSMRITKMRKKKL